MTYTDWHTLWTFWNRMTAEAAADFIMGKVSKAFYLSCYENAQMCGEKCAGLLGLRKAS